MSDLDRFERELERAERTLISRGRQGLVAAGEDLKTRALPFTPFLTGALRESAYVQDISSRTTPEVEVGYRAPYAAVQHENLEFNHPVGQAKYLEEPLRESPRRVLRFLRDAMRR